MPPLVFYHLHRHESEGIGMYLLFNRTNGNFGKLGMHGIVAATQCDADTVAALEKLTDGEYCYIGSFVIVRAANGVTLEELKDRKV